MPAARKTGPRPPRPAGSRLPGDPFGEPSSMSSGVQGSWAAQARHETPMQQADRNFNEMLQELRVAQTGTQILFAFLLTVAFQSGFHALHGLALAVYAVTVVTAALATCFLIAPVAIHR